MTPRYKDDTRKQMMAETRSRLVQAAVEEFAREGFEGASISRITQAAGVATGTIYNYFPSKNEMMLAILTEIGTAHCAFIAERVRQEDDPTERVKRLFEAVSDYVRANPDRASVLVAMLQGANATFKVHLNQIYQPMAQLVCDEILIPGMEREIFQPANPASTTLMIMTFFLGIGSIMNEKGEMILDLNEVTAFVLRALGASVPKNL